MFHLPALLCWRVAIALFKRFANEQQNFHFWLLCMPADPMLDDLKKHPEFNPIMKEIERKFRKKHEEIKEQWVDDLREL